MPCDEFFSYMADMDRGGLTWPTDLLLGFVVQCILVFKCLVSRSHVTKFNVLRNQRARSASYLCFGTSAMLKCP